jgi:orotate phosphoribosyltransferase
MDAKEAAGLLLDAKALAFSVKSPYTFASGIISPVYMDCRLLISDVGRRAAIADALARDAAKAGADTVAATASAGIPWGAWVAERLKMPMVYVRQAAKDHGKGKRIEGSVAAGMRAVVVEDLVSTGGSSISTVEALRAEGVEVRVCASIFTYGLAEAREAFGKAGVTLTSLSSFGEAVGVAVERGYLTAGEAAEAKEWAKEPKRWRKWNS